MLTWEEICKPKVVREVREAKGAVRVTVFLGALEAKAMEELATAKELEEVGMLKAAMAGVVTVKDLKAETVKVVKVEVKV